MAFAGSVTRQLTAHRGATGSLDFSGEGSTFAVELIGGAISWSGSLLRKLTAHRSLSGSVDGSGALGRVGTFHRGASGPLDFEGGELFTSTAFFESVAGALGALVGTLASVLNPVTVARWPGWQTVIFRRKR